MTRGDDGGRGRRYASVGALVVGLVVLVLVGLLAYFIVSGGPVANERACVDGEAPANNTQGGSSCFKEGSQLPRGYTWDPRGNYKIG